MKVLTAEEMAAADRRLIEEVGIPGPVLMENAAAGAVEALLADRPDLDSAWIACGPGNNGGDGLAVGRLLAARGVRVTMLLAFGERDPSPQAALQLRVARALDLFLLDVPADSWPDAVRQADGECDVLVDGLFGTGLSRPLEGEYASLVEAWNECTAWRVALDLPSGLDGSTGAVCGPHARADLTVTFGAPKVAHVITPAADACGEVVVADLGVPVGKVVRNAATVSLVEPGDVAWLAARRPASAHKGTFGHVLIAGGSEGKTGAMALACRGALRAGAGLVTAAVPGGLVAVVDGASLEAMTLALGAATDVSLGSGAVSVLLEAARPRDAFVLGPGLGSEAAARKAARSVALGTDAPLVLDADGLNAFAGRVEDLRRRTAPTVLTPHPRELARLLGTEASEIQADRLSAVRHAVQASGAVVVLKGRNTLVGVPEGPVRVNPTGNPGLGTAGTGDVLAGILGALLAQGVETARAAEGGAYLHGLAGDLAAERCGERSVTAGDVVLQIGRAVRRVAKACAAG